MRTLHVVRMLDPEAPVLRDDGRNLIDTIFRRKCGYCETFATA
ncbi:hypothetical protein [Erythrobacter donghaensis]|nr:hypothetical protein [Erythrobacter donghaensis]